VTGKLYFNYQLLCSSLLVRPVSFLPHHLLPSSLIYFPPTPFSLYFSIVETWSFWFVETTTATWLTYGFVVPFFVWYILAWAIYFIGISLAYFGVKKEKSCMLWSSMVMQVSSL